MVNELKNIMKKIDFTKFPKIINFVKFVNHYEGPNPNNLAMKNCNPINIRCMPKDKKNWNHLASDGVGGFCIFPDIDTGWYAANEKFYNIATGASATYSAGAKKLGLKDSSELTITQMFCIFAPLSDGNNPYTYANWIALRMGVNADIFRMKDLLS